MNYSIVQKCQTFSIKGQLKLIGNGSRNTTYKKPKHIGKVILTMNLLEDHSQVTEMPVMSYRETSTLRGQTNSPKLNFQVLRMLTTMRKLTQVVSKLAYYKRCCWMHLNHQTLFFIT